MSIFDDVLNEEYERIQRIHAAYIKELAALGEDARGSVRMKRINNKQYPYRQYREGSKIKSIFIKSDELEKVKKTIQRRKELEDAVKRIEKEKKRLEKILSHKK